ncbi:ribonuclease P [Halomicrobium mukohataei]|uniref:Ribonuclease P protein component 2 n=1 Tax=Halomicrobium mukohataei TaxID=57705 RepID=A0A847UET3_9EURY|nr:Rpp14/Pop5 family protein [Halomicrobium mukohataei]NLV10747.1 ribonuclease P [Halomicrobium mukohataei]
MKHLPKHLQPRWRYLGVEIESWPDADFGRRALQRELWYAAQNLVGDAGSADLDLTVLRFAFEDGLGSALVRTRRGRTDSARAVIASLSTVDDDSVGVRVRGTSGTVRACEEKYIRRASESSAQRQVAFDGDERTAVVRDGRVDVATDDGFSGATDLDLQ